METKSDAAYEWIIIGAGPHGVHLAACLVEQGTPKSQILLLDKYPKPLYAWTQQTARLKMGHLRSSAVHHLGPSPWSLLDFATQRYGKPSSWSAAPYQRPAYDVFQQHCEFVMAEYGIDSMFRQSCVNKVRKDASDRFLLETDDGTLASKRVILSVGQPPPNTPTWAMDNSRVQHLLSCEWNEVTARVAVVGSGMTACQFCLANLGVVEKLTLVAPTLPKISDFDADPCWIGPKCRTPEFEKLSPQETRQVIKKERRPGSVNATVHEDLHRALNSGRIEFRSGRVMGMSGSQLEFDSGESLDVDSVVLGTGFQKVRPGGAFVDELIDDLSLRTAPCDYPILSEHLEWTKGLYVTGGLAELRLGPVSRNITGARSAAKLILEHARLQEPNREKVLA